MAKSASVTDMMLFRGADAPLPHGGDLDAARRLFPGAPEPFIDLSTGINPSPYPVPRLAAEAFTRLPAVEALRALAAVAARAYGAPSAAHVVPAPGTQLLLPLVAALAPPGRAAILTPTYTELARAATLAGHRAQAVRALDDIGDARLVILANPNNPDGRLHSKDTLLKLARGLRPRTGFGATRVTAASGGKRGSWVLPP